MKHKQALQNALIAFAVVCISLPLGAQPLCSPDALQKKPNIVVIMTDDLDVGVLNTLIELGLAPNIKTYLVDQGTGFTNSYVTDSSCCPSRATFLTGQYAHNHGVLNNVRSSGGGVVHFDDSNTLATWLQTACYRTGHIGKYLNGYGVDDANKDGVFNLADLSYVPPGWSDWQVMTKSTNYQMYGYTVNDNGNLVAYGNQEADFQTDVLAKRAVTFIKKASDDPTPFFLVVTPLAPHVEVSLLTYLQSPWAWDLRPAPRHVDTVVAPLPRPPSFDEVDFSDKPQWMQDFRPPMTMLDTAQIARRYQHRLESMRSVDDLVGNVIDSLSSAGKLDNTVILFTSDNGYLHGEHRQHEKFVAFEESIRVPLYVRVPGGSTQTRSQVVINNDLAPTIAELAGVTPQLTVDGTSFVPLLGTPPDSWRRRFLVEHWQTDNVQASDVPTDVPSYAAIRSWGWFLPNLLYVQYEDPAQTPELYDMMRDPFQLNSLHAEKGPLRVAQRSLLQNWLAMLQACQGASCHVREFDAPSAARSGLLAGTETIDASSEK